MALNQSYNQFSAKTDQDQEAKAQGEVEWRVDFQPSKVENGYDCGSPMGTPMDSGSAAMEDGQQDQTVEESDSGRLSRRKIEEKDMQEDGTSNKEDNHWKGARRRYNSPADWEVGRNQQPGDFVRQAAKDLTLRNMIDMGSQEQGQVNPARIPEKIWIQLPDGSKMEAILEEKNDGLDGREGKATPTYAMNIVHDQENENDELNRDELLDDDIIDSPQRGIQPEITPVKQKRKTRRNEFRGEPNHKIQRVIPFRLPVGTNNEWTTNYEGPSAAGEVPSESAIQDQMNPGLAPKGTVTSSCYKKIFRSKS